MDILVNKDTFRLYYNGTIYPIGIGILAYPTPIGFFPIYAKECDPVGSDEVGTRCIYFHPQAESKNRYPAGSYRKLAIHGIGKSEGIGKRSTLGCVAMHNKDVEELYDLVSLGDKLLVFSRFDMEGWSA